MEVYDSEDEHLASVLPNYRDDQEDEDDDSSRIFVSPTEQETRSKLAADKRRAMLDQPARTVFRGTPLGNVSSSIETDTSSQRYQHLPAYAQTTFVQEVTSIPKKLDIPKDLPQGMLVPSDDRQNTILRRTAQSVAESPQLEVMIKIKQADNPDLSFLELDDKFHPYYQWCKGIKERNRIAAAAALEKERELENRAALGGLLDAYSSSSSDDDDKPTPKRVIVGSDDDAIQKARRLERAKKLREHFQSKMNS